MTGNNQMSVLQAGDSEKLFLYLVSISISILLPRQTDDVSGSL